MSSAGVRDARRNYAVVGCFVLAMLGLGILWLALLAGRTGTADGYEIHFVNVMGLVEGAAVRYQGYRIGTVESIERLPTDRDGAGFRVRVRVRRGWTIPDDSVGTISAFGLLAAVGVEIEAGSSSRALAPGARIESRERVDSFEAIGQMAGRMGALVQDLEPFLEELGRGAPEILANLRSLSEELNDSARRLGEIVSPENTERVREILIEIRTATHGYSRLAADLQRTRARADGLLASVDGVVAENRADVRAVVEDLRASLDDLAFSSGTILTNLEAASRDLAEFSDQIRRDPSRILRSRPAEPR